MKDPARLDISVFYWERDKLEAQLNEACAAATALARILRSNPT